MASSKITAKSSVWRTGEPYVWVSAAALTLILLITVALMGVILINGLGVLWPTNVVRLDLADGGAAMGEHTKTDPAGNNNAARIQLKVGNRDLYQLDFRWISEEDIAERSWPEDAVVLAPEGRRDPKHCRRSAKAWHADRCPRSRWRSR